MRGNLVSIVFVLAMAIMIFGVTWVFALAGEPSSAWLVCDVLGWCGK